MLKERAAGIVGRVPHAVRTFRSGERRSKPEFPLSPEQRVLLEEACRDILKKEDFGREDFGNFCKNMIALVRKDGGQIKVARLKDQEAGLDIQFNENEISMQGKPVATDDPGVSELGFYEHISYRSQKVKYGLFGDKYSDYQPTLTTEDRVPVPSSITFFSYFKGESEPAFTKGRYHVKRGGKVSDKDVQGFCEKVYGVYAVDKIGVNFPPR